MSHRRRSERRRDEARFRARLDQQKARIDEIIRTMPDEIDAELTKFVISRNTDVGILDGLLHELATIALLEVHERNCRWDRMERAIGL